MGAPHRHGWEWDGSGRPGAEWARLRVTCSSARRPSRTTLYLVWWWRGRVSAMHAAAGSSARQASVAREREATGRLSEAGHGAGAAGKNSRTDSHCDLPFARGCCTPTLFHLRRASPAATLSRPRLSSEQRAASNAAQTAQASPEPLMRRRPCPPWNARGGPRGETLPSASGTPLKRTDVEPAGWEMRAHLDRWTDDNGIAKALGDDGGGGRRRAVSGRGAANEGGQQRSCDLADRAARCPQVGPRLLGGKPGKPSLSSLC